MGNRESIDIDIDLEHIHRAIKRSWLMASGAFALCIALAGFASTQLRPTYQADTKLLFTNVDSSSALTGFSNDAGQLQSLLIDQTPLSTQMQVITSRPLLLEVIERLNLQDDDGTLLTPKMLGDNIEIAIIGGTDVLELTYTNADPEIAADALNTLVDVYRRYTVAVNRTESREAKEFLLQQLPRTEAIVRQADNELRNFLEENSISVLEEEASSLISILEGLDNQISATEADMQAAAARSSFLQNQLGLTARQALVVGSLSQNPGVQETLTALQTVERELASQRVRYNPTSPVVRQLRAEQTSLQQLLREQIESNAGGRINIPTGMIQASPLQQTIMQTLIQDFLTAEADKISLHRELSALASRRADYQSRIGNIPTLKVRLRELERRLRTAEQTYEALLTSLQALEVRENETTYNTRVIEPATVPDQPTSGTKIKILALGVMGGAFIAIAIIVFSDVLTSQNSRKSEKDYITPSNDDELGIESDSHRSSASMRNQ